MWHICHPLQNFTPYKNWTHNLVGFIFLSLKTTTPGSHCKLIKLILYIPFLTTLGIHWQLPNVINPITTAICHSPPPFAILHYPPSPSTTRTTTHNASKCNWHANNTARKAEICWPRCHVRTKHVRHNNMNNWSKTWWTQWDTQEGAKGAQRKMGSAYKVHSTFLLFLFFQIMSLVYISILSDRKVLILFFLDILSGKVWFVLVSWFIYYFGHPVSFLKFSCDFWLFYIPGLLRLLVRGPLGLSFLVVCSLFTFTFPTFVFHHMTSVHPQGDATVQVGPGHSRILRTENRTLGSVQRSPL